MKFSLSEKIGTKRFRKIKRFFNSEVRILTLCKLPSTQPLSPRVMVISTLSGYLYICVTFEKK